MKAKTRIRQEYLMKRAFSAISIATFISTGAATSAYANHGGDIYFATGSKQIAAYSTASIRVVCPPDHRMVVEGSQWIKNPTEGLMWISETGELPNDPLNREYATFHVTNVSDTYRVVQVGTDCTNRLLP